MAISTLQPQSMHHHGQSSGNTNADVEGAIMIGAG
jgi:hypothetical protein